MVEPIPFPSLLPTDWPKWAVQVVHDEAKQFSAEVSRPWVQFDLALKNAVESSYRVIERTVKANLDLEADEAWWDRFDEGKLEAEIEAALVSYTIAA